MSWRAAYVLVALLVIAGAVAVSVPRCGEWLPAEKVAVAPSPELPPSPAPELSPTPEEQATPEEEKPEQEEQEEATPTPEKPRAKKTPTPARAEKRTTPTPQITPTAQPERKPTPLVHSLTWRLAADAEVADRQISEAQRAVQQNDVDAAQEHIRLARNAVVFLQTEIPSVLVLQGIQRADVLAGTGDMHGAIAALDTVEDLADDVRLRTSLKTFRGHLENARTLLERGIGQRAREELAALAQAVVDNETRSLAEKVIEHLDGAARAGQRGSLLVMKAELEEAKAAMYQLNNTIEEHAGSP